MAFAQVLASAVQQSGGQPPHASLPRLVVVFVTAQLKVSGHVIAANSDISGFKFPQ